MTRLRVNLDQSKQVMINLAPYLSVTTLLLSSLYEEEDPWQWYYSHHTTGVCHYSALSNFISRWLIDTSLEIYWEKKARSNDGYIVWQARAETSGPTWPEWYWDIGRLWEWWAVWLELSRTPSLSVSKITSKYGRSRWPEWRENTTNNSNLSDRDLKRKRPR